MNIIHLRKPLPWFAIGRASNTASWQLSKPKGLQAVPYTVVLGCGNWCISPRLPFISIHSCSGILHCKHRVLSLGCPGLNPEPFYITAIIVHAIGGDLPPCKRFNYLWLGTGRLPVDYNLQVGFSPGGQKSERSFWLTACKVPTLYTCRHRLSYKCPQFVNER